jgi:MoxR-like ATPase
MYKNDVEAADALAAKYSALKQEIAKVIVGQDDVVDKLLIALFCKGHVLLVGVPGLAKTLLVSTI